MIMFAHSCLHIARKQRLQAWNSHLTSMKYSSMIGEWGDDNVNNRKFGPGQKSRLLFDTGPQNTVKIKWYLLLLLGNSQKSQLGYRTNRGLSCTLHNLLTPGGLSLCLQLSTDGAALIYAGSMFQSFTVSMKKECLNWSECIQKCLKVYVLFLVCESAATMKLDAGTPIAPTVIL